MVRARFYPDPTIRSLIVLSFCFHVDFVDDVKLVYLFIIFVIILTHHRFPR